MPENLKRFRIHYKSKVGDQYVTLLARNRAEAEVLAGVHQANRARRHDITFQRIGEAADRGELTSDQYVREVERRKKDFSRYDIVSGDEVGCATAPLKLTKIEEPS